MVKASLFSRQQSGGVFMIEDNSLSTGDRFFVDSGSATKADSVGAGQNPDKPFATLDFAVSQCAANNGDIIYAMPGHAEVVSAAAGLDLDVAGITIIGLGDGASTPTVTLGTANTADVDIDAANITVENIHFVGNFLDIVAGIDVNADDFTLKNCRFTDTATNLNVKIWIQPGSANVSDRLKIIDCSCICKGANNTHFINMSAAQDGMVIQGNRLMGNWETMCIGGTGVVTYCSILNNTIFNEVTDADHCIVMASTSTGVMAGNMATGGHASQGIIPGDLGSLENYYEGNTSDLSGVLDPASA